MATNGAASRKTPAASKPSTTKTEESNTLGIPLENLFDDLENEPTSDFVEDVKEKLPRVKHAGSWSTEVNTGTGIKAKDANARTTPAINKVPSILAKAFPNGKLMADKPDTLRCNHCKRPVAKHAMSKHVERCLNKKQEKQRKKKEAKDARDAAARKEKAGDSDEEEEDGSKKTASKTGGMTASKKRKATDEGEEGAPTKKKKRKDEPKTKAPRPKAPVDVEKQCGVELPQGGQCARSLTCKSHSMGAKRAVPGRSAPYDKLLMEYQRKNQAKMQKAAFDANAPNPDDNDLPSGPVDSEEEKDAVMSSIARHFGGAPIYQPMPVPLRRKYEVNRIKGMLSSAFAGAKSSSGAFGSSTSGGGNFWGTNTNPGPIVDADGMVHARRGSVVPGARSMMAPSASRKPSVASGA
ncbi:uncharacterized protein MYCFIDRAFT_83020 [Pseudocercospora fijiensis CIRAD86]|uniref:SCA7 domain-containing protein n=1 Tax=Pseudocercospora fijiensis (strain CIRAD86) TaxID=383855 RepID=M3A1C6_PSEFD|nr:uncharacterized protein MYCFIDRAFT_83020 [Pseudocercospora fijiensis CIRAD86]EME84969.1 hypothetical protein MYCFIDRAFT_83020 [Pseudocercospora fijiensis CIRAD86]